MTTATHYWDILQVILSTGRREARLWERVFYDKDELIPGCDAMALRRFSLPEAALPELIPVRCSALEFEFCVRPPGGRSPGQHYALHLDECPETEVAVQGEGGIFGLSLRLIDADEPFDFEELDEQDGRYDAWA